MKSPAFELALMIKAEAGQRAYRDCGSPEFAAGKSGGGARLVMIFQEARHLRLVVVVGPQMSPRFLRGRVHKRVIEPLVVGVVETELLHAQLHVPIDFSDPDKVRDG